MKRALYNKILNTIDKEVKNIINEQFSISDLDFSSDEQGYNTNIFSKELNHRYYYKVLDGTVNKNEIKELNSLTCVATPTDKNKLKKM